MIRIEHSQLTRAALDAALLESRFRDETKIEVKAAAVEVVADGKTQMPVDTGAARSRWGGIFEERNGGLEIAVGAELDPYEYINALNEGHSSQAPAGFIDTIAVNAADDLGENIIRRLVDAF